MSDVPATRRYVVMAMLAWDTITCEVPGLLPAKPLRPGPEFGAGVLPVFETYEAALEHYPHRNVIAVDIDQAAR